MCKDTFAPHTLAAVQSLCDNCGGGSPPKVQRRDRTGGAGAPARFRAGDALGGREVEVFYCYRLTAKTKDPPYGNSHFLKTGFCPPFLP